MQCVSRRRRTGSRAIGAGTPDSLPSHVPSPSPGLRCAAQSSPLIQGASSAAGPLPSLPEAPSGQETGRHRGARGNRHRRAVSRRLAAHTAIDGAAPPSRGQYPCSPHITLEPAGPSSDTECPDPVTRSLASSTNARTDRSSPGLRGTGRAALHIGSALQGGHRDTPRIESRRHCHSWACWPATCGQGRTRRPGASARLQIVRERYPPQCFGICRQPPYRPERIRTAFGCHNEPDQASSYGASTRTARTALRSAPPSADRTREITEMWSSTRT